MKHFIKNILLFTAFVIMSYPVFLLLWGLSPLNRLGRNVNVGIATNGHLRTRILELEKTRNVDILFLGSSHAYRGFDTRIFKKRGYRCFNLGSSSQTPIQTEFLLHRYLDQLNPKVIIFETFPRNFASDGVESSWDIVVNTPYGPDTTKMICSQNNIKLYNIALFTQLLNSVKGKSTQKEPLKIGKDRYIEGGFVEKDPQVRKSSTDRVKPAEMNNRQLMAFRRIITLFNKKKIPYLLVFSPITPELYSSFSKRDTYWKTMSENGPFLDFNKIIKLNEHSHFYDRHHLNQAGVTLFNEKLLSLIENQSEQDVSIPHNIHAALQKLP